MEDPLQILNLSRANIQTQLLEIKNRSLLETKRQQKFTMVETLLCYGLFYIVDPHKYGGSNIDKVPETVKTLATFVKRRPASLLYKMLNLDGSLKHAARYETSLFAYLARYPHLFFSLYQEIIGTAREMKIDNDALPDFLEAAVGNDAGDLLGQEELPMENAQLLADENAREQMKKLDQRLRLPEQETEKVVEQTVRLTQSRFAREVLMNCDRTCVFCGFKPDSLPRQNGLLRASHIKPWRASNHKERMTVTNGLTACPTHDVAFDQGYLTVNTEYRIITASILRESIVHDQGVSHYFQRPPDAVLILPQIAQWPGKAFLRYHYEHIFKGL